MQEKLKEIGQLLLQEPEDLGSIWKACGDYKKLLLEFSGLDFQGEQERSNIQLQQGMALGTTWAAYCLDDFVRTKRFIKGICQAIRRKLDEGQNRPVHLLYAGTGPFATLVLPLTSFFTPNELQLTLLEINPISYQNLEQVFNYLDLQTYVRRMELTDATQYRIPDGEQIDILLSETMQAGLRKEAQVPIFQHLLSQPGAREATLIPQRIELFLGAYSSKLMTENTDHKTVKFGSYFRLDRSRILAPSGETPPQSLPAVFPSVSITVPATLSDQYDKMAILTEIDIFQDQQLSFNESGLTVPLMIQDLSREPASGRTLNIAYRLEHEPGEVITFENQKI